MGRFFSNEGFLPHIHCYLDRPSLVGTMLTTDLLIGISYIIISFTLYMLMRKIRPPFRIIFLAFGVFILACGLTHFAEVYTLWHPKYWISAGIKIVTALASVATAIYLVRIFPQIVEFGEVIKESSSAKSKLQEFLLRKVSTPPQVKKLLTKTVLLPFALAAGLLIISLVQVRYLNNLESWVEHSNQVIQLGHDLETYALDAQAQMFSYWMTDVQKLKVSSNENSELFESTFKKLLILVNNNAEQWRRLTRVGSSFRAWQNYIKSNLATAPDEQTRQKALKTFITKNEQYRRRTFEAMELFLVVERNIRTQRTEWTKKLSEYFLASIGLLTFFLGSLFAIYGRNALRRIAASFGIALEAEKQAKEKLRRAVATRDDFLSIASHELKTPLTSLKLHMQMSRRWFKSDQKLIPAEKLAKTLEVSNTQVDRLQNLVDDLLDVSRINAGKLQFRLERVDVSKLVSEVVERHSESVLEAHGCETRLEIEHPSMVLCDRFRMEQVITNLITNAAKYGNGKPVTICVRKSEEKALIAVKDEGIGIPRDKIDKIFERFERAVAPRGIGGLGLGLYISKEIVQAHGGTIEVQSEPGHGSTFTVELPTGLKHGEAS